MPRKIVSVLALLTVVLLVAVFGLAGGAYWFLRASLPQLDGERRLPGLTGEVVVERDGQGIATVRGERRLDVARATGFIHAQERFFQMDLLRRSAAGELAALVGPAALALDRDMRLHGLRRVAEAVVAGLPEPQRQLLQSYVEGVNAGLQALGARPFEYALLRTAPRPWEPADSVLVVLAMFVDLQDRRATREVRLAAMLQALPPALVLFLTAHDTGWDAPLDGSELEPAALPSPEQIDLRRHPPREVAWGEVEPVGDEPAVGSNSWAIAPQISADGHVWLANDMHLGLRMPNIWYRLRLEWRQGDAWRAVTGVSLPGTPAVVVGSNGRVAWGFTNSYGDWADLVELELDPDDPERYLTPNGYRRFQRRVERIEVKGGVTQHVEFRDTVWGPLLKGNGAAPPRALRWVAHYPEAIGLELLELETANGLEEALAIANRAGLPAQNFVAVDSAGNIGWTIAGRLPRRRGYDPSLPSAGAAGGGWQGWVEPQAYQRIVNPEDGLLWTANNRIVGGEALQLLGDGGLALGSRAVQIRAGLQALGAATPADLLAIQLDDRALFLARWRGLMLDLLDEAAVAADARRAELRDVLLRWRGRAVPEAVAYRLVRAFRLFLHEAVFKTLTAPVEALDPDFRFDFPQAEQALWRLATEQPPHLLDAGYADWRELLLAVIDRVIDYFWDEAAGLQEATWGEFNRLRMVHPLTHALPWLGRWLNAPAEPMAGDSHMPRVQLGSHGASQRLVVSPAREEQSLLHMPGGQSGHPLSPFYRVGHDDWVAGRPTPLLPGPAQHRLLLRP